MKKIFTVLSILISLQVVAQQSTTVLQTIDLHLVNVIKIKFVQTEEQTGPIVHIPLGNINDMMNGVKSTNQNLAVSSTKPFNVNVRSSSMNFSYSGNYQQAPSMPVAQVLKLRVNQNGTGGNIGNGFGTFMPVPTSALNLINGGTGGVNRTFRVRYLATPGLEYPAGDYLTAVIYTATQQ